LRVRETDRALTSASSTALVVAVLVTIVAGVLNALDVVTMHVFFVFEARPIAMARVHRRNVSFAFRANGIVRHLVALRDAVATFATVKRQPGGRIAHVHHSTLGQRHGDERQQRDKCAVHGHATK